MESPQSARARGRARLRNLTALTAGLSIAGVVGVAVATHSAGTTTTNNTKSSTNDDGSGLQAPTSNPQNTQQQPQANSNGS